MARLTSGGTVKTAEPTLDLHLLEVENGRLEVEQEKAGTRKSGNGEEVLDPNLTVRQAGLTRTTLSMLAAHCTCALDMKSGRHFAKRRS